MTSLLAKKTRSAGNASGWRRRAKTALLGMSMLTLALAAALPLEAPGKADSDKTPPAPIVVTALVWAPDWADDLQRVADAFTREYPTIRIDLQFMIGNSIEENLKPKFATGKLPDLFSLHPNPYAASLADQGLLADLGTTQSWLGMPDALRSDWISPGGLHFGIPHGLATTLIYYNRTMFERAGIKDTPENFEAFIATAEKLKKAGFTPLALSGSFPSLLAAGPFSYGFANDIAAHIPDWRTRIEDGTLAMDTRQGTDIFAKLKMLADKQLLQPDFMAAGYEETLHVFTSGHAAMTFQGSWDAAKLMQNKSLDVGVFIPPWNASNQRLAPVIGSEPGLAVATRSSPAVRQAAIQFIDFLHGKGLPLWQSKRMNIPPFKTMPAHVTGNRELSVLVDKLEQPGAAPGLYYTYLPANTIERLHTLLQSVLYGTRTPGEAARLLHNSISDQVRANNK